MTRTADQMQLTDKMDLARTAALNVVLGVTGDAPHPFAHQAYFWDAQPAEALGRDGHPKLGGLIPDFGLPRRMWAGGQLIFHAPLQLGQDAVRTTTVEQANRKTGRTGDLAFVTLRHEITQNGGAVVTELQDLVYRQPSSPHAPAPRTSPAPTNETIRQDRGFTTTELFRYSALTFNGHRIHYDQDYAQQVEGYPGLVVHGPLLAQYLMLLAERELGHLRKFNFRATAPLFDFEQASLCAKSSGDGLELWVRAEDGRLCMTASAQ